MVKLLIGDNMKKHILVVTIIFISFLTVGCSMDMKKKAVEMYINEYQKLEKNVNYFGENSEKITKKQKEEYIELVKKQYQNMSYKIINIEDTDDNAKAYLEVEIYDYKSSMDNSKKYYKDNPEKFTKDRNYDEEKYENYKLKELKKVQDRKKIYITLNLYKVNDKWYVEDLNNEDLLKITDLSEENV